jgi:hypothetical protein
MAGRPGQIPAQLVGHTLFYFTQEQDLIFDPMAGGGVVPDTCLAFNRRCWSFDLADRPETRPEIEPHQWNPERLVSPVKGKERPDLFIFADPAPGLRFELPGLEMQGILSMIGS